MTLPTTGAISTDAILAELQVASPSRALPLSLTDADVLSLAGKSSGPLSIPADLYGKSSYVPMVVTGVNDSAFAYSGSTSGSAVCHPSVNVANGLGTKSFLWSFTSNPDGATLSNATSQTCTVSHSYTRNAAGSANATLQCVVTDSKASVTTSGITASLDWSP